MLKIYLELTRQAGADRPDLIVWPETAAPTALRRDPGLLQTLTAHVGARCGRRCWSARIDVLDGDPPGFTNTAFLVDRAGHRGPV